jgi:poly(A) polymerase
MSKKILVEQILGKQFEISLHKFNNIFSPSLIEFIKLVRSYGFEIRVIGGAVRDLLEGRIPNDVDLVTNAKPTEMLYILERNEITHTEKGIQHGTIKVLLNYDTKYEEEYEISSLDFWIPLTEEQGNTHDSWFLDALHRDLTMNAMAIDADGRLWDYFNGIEDLRNQTLRIPGIPEEGFNRNPIVALRWFRFLGYFKKPRFDRTIPGIIEKVYKETPNYFDDLYGKRIWSEFSKILMGKNPITTLKLMEQIGLKDGLKFNWGNPELLRQPKKTCRDPWALVALIMPNGDIERFGEFWEWLPLQAQKVIWLQTTLGSDPDFEQGKEWILNGIQPDWVINLFLLKGKTAIANELTQWRLPHFPLKPTEVKTENK